MSRPPRRIPAPPIDPEPPEALLRARDRALGDAAVARAGLTTTPDGRWALDLRLRTDADVPSCVRHLEAEGIPLYVERDLGDPPVARPAFPVWGE